MRKIAKSVSKLQTSRNKSMPIIDQLTAAAAAAAADEQKRVAKVGQQKTIGQLKVRQKRQQQQQHWQQPRRRDTKHSHWLISCSIERQPTSSTFVGCFFLLYSCNGVYQADMMSRLSRFVKVSAKSQVVHS